MMQCVSCGGGGGSSAAGVGVSGSGAYGSGAVNYPMPWNIKGNMVNPYFGATEGAIRTAPFTPVMSKPVAVSLPPSALVKFPVLNAGINQVKAVLKPADKPSGGSSAAVGFSFSKFPWWILLVFLGFVCFHDRHGNDHINY